MTEQTKRLVPELRFPEFQGSAEWEVKRIGQISENVTAGGTPSTSEKEYWGGTIRWMNSGELNYKIVHEVQGRITEKGLRNSSTKITPKMCVLIGLAGQGKTRGTVAMNMIELCINQSIAAIYPNEEKFSSDFLYHNLDNRYDELRSLSTGGEGRGGLNLQIIKSLGVPLPRLKEQQKIADCLSSIDQLITAQTNKISALKDHKKGLMQQLFPAEDETVPKLRFPEFQGDWHAMELGKCFKNVGGTALEKFVTVEGTHHFISIGNYSTDGKYIDKGQRVELNEVTNFKLLNKNDLVMVLNDKTAAGDIIGATLLIEEDDKYIYNQRSERLIITPELIPIFAWHLLNSEVVRKKVFKMSQGGTQIYVNFPAVKTIKLIFPKDPFEQQNIADCLSSVGELITTQTQKLEAFKTHKKGLMQQLFPVADEAGE